MYSPSRRLYTALLLLVAIVVIGTSGFMILEHWSLKDAIYMTLITISTLGMLANPSFQVGSAGQIWVMFLIIVGIAGAMIALTTIVSMVVEGHMRSILGRRMVDKKISLLQQHIIVCGYGLMGQTIAAELKQRRVEVLVIDNDDHQTAHAEREGFLYILGDATDESLLKAAGIDRARALVAVLDSDASNVFATLVARDLNRNLYIATRAEKKDSVSRLLRAGANTAICPQMIGASRLSNILTRPGVVDFIDFAAQGMELEAEQYKLTPENKLIGQTLRQANLPRLAGILVIALKRSNGQTIFNPDPDLLLQEGDIMVITGQAGSLAKLEGLYH